jgi:hypothetical protein
MGRMADLHDHIEDAERDRRRATAPARHADDQRLLDDLDARGVSPILARKIAEYIGWAAEKVPNDDTALADLAEETALADLLGQCDADPDNPTELAMARKQAAYARRLWVNYGFLVNNLHRNLYRLDRKTKGAKRHKRRPHVTLDKLTPHQNAEAERMWLEGATHGLTWHEARLVRARENGAVYRRVHRILKLAAKMST